MTPDDLRALADAIEALDGAGLASTISTIRFRGKDVVLSREGRPAAYRVDFLR